MWGSLYSELLGLWENFLSSVLVLWNLPPFPLLMGTFHRMHECITFCFPHPCGHVALHFESVWTVFCCGKADSGQWNTSFLLGWMFLKRSSYIYCSRLNFVSLFFFNSGIVQNDQKSSFVLSDRRDMLFSHSCRIILFYKGENWRLSEFSMITQLGRQRMEQGCGHQPCSHLKY